ncbi:hypothetical protein LAZ67_6002833 [Cordylochernes scorpioides]|uniref:HECT domain-containing protein n=1 Tax=Cordylochernes scorpioides TaxID=51811 RepID=A0ABY6KK32_9ARAC|nr:hypothetical protein LAZ67_6002833 [Cordylochernes scorpioides]
MGWPNIREKLKSRPIELPAVFKYNSDYSWDILESVTQYEGDYTRLSKVIQNLWKIFREEDQAFMQAFLMFSTGSAPVGDTLDHPRGKALIQIYCLSPTLAPIPSYCQNTPPKPSSKRNWQKFTSTT